jgi:hypothetical protein
MNHLNDISVLDHGERVLLHVPFAVLVRQADLDYLDLIAFGIKELRAKAMRVEET